MSDTNKNKYLSQPTDEEASGFTSVPRPINREKELENDKLAFATTRPINGYHVMYNPVVPVTTKHAQFNLDASDDTTPTAMSSWQAKKYFNATGPIKEKFLKSSKMDGIASEDDEAMPIKSHKQWKDTSLIATKIKDEWSVDA